MDAINKSGSGHELKELRRRVDEMEKRIDTYRSEEIQWKERERRITELIRDREREIESLKAILKRMYGKNG